MALCAGGGWLEKVAKMEEKGREGGGEGEGKGRGGGGEGIRRTLLVLTLTSYYIQKQHLYV